MNVRGIFTIYIAVVFLSSSIATAKNESGNGRKTLSGGDIVVPAAINVEAPGNYNGSKTYSNGSSYDISIDIRNREYCVFVGGQMGCSELYAVESDYVIESNLTTIKFYTHPYFNSSCKHSFSGSYSKNAISGSFFNPNCADTSNGSWSVEFSQIVVPPEIQIPGDNTNIPDDNSSGLKPNPKIYINTNSQYIYKNEVLQVFFNTSVFSDKTEKYDVYLSVSWDDKVVFDNGSELVSNKVPLYENMEIPKLISWFEYQKLRYTFPEGLPQTNYILGLHLVDNKGDAVFENFSSVSYFPEESPFITTNKPSQKSKSVKTSMLENRRSGSVECNILERGEKAETVDLVLKMGSGKGGYNLFKTGNTGCKILKSYGNIISDYETGLNDEGLTKEQENTFFAITLIETLLTFKYVPGGNFYEGIFETTDFMNGLKDVLATMNDQGYADVDNRIPFSIILEQPQSFFSNLFGFGSDAVNLEVTLTPVFLYDDAQENKTFKNKSKTFTKAKNMKATVFGTALSNSSNLLGNKGNVINSSGGIFGADNGFQTGLYLITASTKKGDKEIFRDTIHLVRKAQEHVMVIHR